MDFPFLSEDEIYDRAQGLLREAFGPGHQPPVDLEALAFDYLYDQKGVYIDVESDLGTHQGEPILGVTLPLENRILIDRALSQGDNSGRYRFTIAHEIGHWVLHCPYFARNRAQTSMFDEAESRMITLKRALASFNVPSEEWQANYFAISLLVEREALAQEFSRRFGTPPVTLYADGDHKRAADLRGLSRGLAQSTQHAPTPLHEFFQTSIEAMAITLESRNLVTETALSV